MTLPDLPLELWESILERCDHQTQFTLRNTCRSWRHHVEKRIIPAYLSALHYRVPDVSILLFNGFHQYRNNQALTYVGTKEAVYHPYRETVEDYAVFAIDDPLRYFKLNRLDDVDDFYMMRDCDVQVDNLQLVENVSISKAELRKYGLIGEDEQSIMLPFHLLCRDDWEILVPLEESWYDGVADSLYGMGTPDQTWTTTFSSGANLPY